MRHILAIDGVWCQFLGLDLDGEVNIGTGVCCAGVHDRVKLVVRCNLPVNTNWRVALLHIVVGTVVIERNVTGDGYVTFVVVHVRSDACPENDTIIVGIA